MNDAQHRLRFLGDKPQEERKGAEGTQRRRGVTQRRKGGTRRRREDEARTLIDAISY